jgi:acyl carrier protein
MNYDDFLAHSQSYVRQMPNLRGLIRFDPSRPTGDTPCPRCKALLWFVVVEDAARCYPHWAVSPRKKQFIAAFTASPDSLDRVELVMELEETLGYPLNEDKIREIRSMSALIDFIIRELPD